MRIALSVTLILIVLASAIFAYSFAMKDAMRLYPRSKKSADDKVKDYRKGLLRLQADLDQQIAEAETLVENANMPVPEWVRANEALRDLERTRAAIEGKLRAE